MAVSLLGSLAPAEHIDVSSGSATVSHTLAAGSNRWVVLMAAGEDASVTFNGATYDGQTMTEIGNVAQGSQDAAIYAIKESLLSGTGTKTASLLLTAGIYNRVRINVIAVQDADQSDIAAAQKGTNSNASTNSLVVSLTSITGGYAFAEIVNGNNVTGSIAFAGGTLGTEDNLDSWNIEGQCRAVADSVPVTTGASLTATGSFGDVGSCAGVAFCFSPVAGGGGGEVAERGATRGVVRGETRGAVMRQRMKQLGSGLWAPERKILVPVGIRL